MGNNVMILGGLGDLVKKIAELEFLERTPTRDTVIQMTAFYHILEQWPVEDKDKVASLISAFKIQVARHKAVEKSLEDLTAKVIGRIGSDDWVRGMGVVRDTLNVYLASKSILKKLLVELNSLGKHIGMPPITVELENEEKESGTPR